jgi:sugar lactone lactonase YvrE
MAKVVIERVLAAQNGLGEGPLWDWRSQLLRWTDAAAKSIWTYDPSSGSSAEVKLSRSVSSIAATDGQELLAAFASRITLIDGAQELETVATCKNPHIERFNDATCDRKGRLWIGTIDKRSAIWQGTGDPPLTEPQGRLYAIGSDGTTRSFDVQVELSNGIAISPDDLTLYHADSYPGRIFASDFDLESGSISRRRVLSDFAGQAGHPDGMTIDSEGCLWVAEIGAGLIVRITPEGRRDAAVKMPISRPTSVAFGGARFDTLFVTSMRMGSEDAMAGDLFAITGLGATGLPVPHFVRR